MIGGAIGETGAQGVEYIQGGIEELTPMAYANALARVREIEADSVARHGEFDWEKLPERVQDEYDGLCVLLDDLQDTGERVGLRDVLHAERSKATR